MGEEGVKLSLHLSFTMTMPWPWSIRNGFLGSKGGFTREKIISPMEKEGARLPLRRHSLLPISIFTRARLRSLYLPKYVIGSSTELLKRSIRNGGAIALATSMQ